MARPNEIGFKQGDGDQVEESVRSSYLMIYCLEIRLQSE